MSTTKIKFESINANQKVSVKSYGYANPDATDYTLKTLVTGINAMSKNSVGKIYRINTTDITSATEGGDTPVINGKYVSLASTSDFFSTDPTTFHTFLQTAISADKTGEGDSAAALTFYASIGAGSFVDKSITYGDIKSLSANNAATVQDFVTLLNGKIATATNPPDITVSFANNTLYFATATGSSINVDIQVGVGEADGIGNYIMKDLYDNAADNSGFDELDGVYGLMLKSA